MIDLLHADRVPDRRPVWFAVDALLAGFLSYITYESLRTESAVAEYGAVRGWEWIVVLGPTLLLLARRLAPATALTVAAAVYVVAAFDHGDGNWILAAPFLAYMVAAGRPPRASAVLIAATGVPIALTNVYGPGRMEVIGLAFTMVGLVIAWFVGVRVRAAQDRAHTLAVEAHQARADGVTIARRAVDEERRRIARELHDAVGHAVNVMVMQAGAARLSATEERTVEALTNIERVGRSALTDLDRMLGLLRSEDDDGAPLEPAHDARDVSALVDQVRSAGTDVILLDECGDEAGRLERPISAAAYRIVQESLTNAVRHAGPARVEVTLRCTTDEMVVIVADDGRGAAAPPSVGGGRGLVGMHERVTVLGGSLVAGPRRSGGYLVEARLPRKAVAP